MYSIRTSVLNQCELFDLVLGSGNLRHIGHHQGQVIRDVEGAFVSWVRRHLPESREGMAMRQEDGNGSDICCDTYASCDLNKNLLLKIKAGDISGL